MSSISSIDFFVGDFLCHFVELFLEKGIFCENFLFLGEKNSKLIFFNLKIHKILAQLFPTMNERVLRIFYWHILNIAKFGWIYLWTIITWANNTKLGEKKKQNTHTDPTHAINGDMFLEPFLNN